MQGGLIGSQKKKNRKTKLAGAWIWPTQRRGPLFQVEGNLGGVGEVQLWGDGGGYWGGKAAGELFAHLVYLLSPLLFPSLFPLLTPPL